MVLLEYSQGQALAIVDFMGLHIIEFISYEYDTVYVHDYIRNEETILDVASWLA